MATYLDANVFIKAAGEDSETGNNARRILSQAAKAKEKYVTSVLTWDEVFWIIKKQFGREKAIGNGANLLQISGVTFVPANHETITLAQELVTRYSLDPRDAIHAATAIQNYCTEIVSTDQDLDKVKELKRIPL